MKRPGPKTSITILLAAGITIAAIAQKPAPKKEPRPKNLQVLPKNISHDSLIDLMKEYSVSLGVRCGFCHVKAADGSDHLDMASDNNRHKKVARYMMKMTAALNDKYFKEENQGHEKSALTISCYTCHRGHEEPEAFVMPKEDEEHH